MIEFSIENLLEVKDELMPLIEDNNQEMKLDDKFSKLSPDWEIYEMLINSHMFLSIFARDEGRLVGYIGYTITPKMLHFDYISAAESDVFYLHPEYRKGRNASKMLKYAEEALRTIGVDVVITRVSIKTEKDVGKLLERMGHSCKEKEYFKWLS